MSNAAFLIEKYTRERTVYARDIRRMISHIKSLSYEDVFFNGATIFLTPEEYDRFLDMIHRYENSTPISKIIHRKSFWRHDFFVNEDVLDPRPETELIVETVLQHFNMNDKLRFIDLGTGSGCILLSLLHEFKKSTGVGIDVSPKAIDVATRNQELLNIDRATFVSADWNDQSKFMGESPDLFDVVVSNPPYIRTDDIASLDENVRKYDPMVALDGGSGGLDAYVRIVAISRYLLKENGMIFLEVGYDQADDIISLLETNGYQSISKAKDINGIDRVVFTHL